MAGLCVEMHLSGIGNLSLFLEIRKRSSDSRGRDSVALGCHQYGKLVFPQTRVLGMQPDEYRFQTRRENAPSLRMRSGALWREAFELTTSSFQESLPTEEGSARDMKSLLRGCQSVLFPKGEDTDPVLSVWGDHIPEGRS